MKRRKGLLNLEMTGPLWLGAPPVHAPTIFFSFVTIIRAKTNNLCASNYFSLPALIKVENVQTSDDTLPIG